MIQLSPFTCDAVCCIRHVCREGGNMKTDSYKKPEINSALTDDGKKDRREFLITAARVIVPTLGLLGISLSMSGARALAADCNSICTGGCQGACTGCTGSCSGTCHWACSDTCKDTCSGMTERR